MTYEIKYLTNKGLPLLCAIYPKKVYVGTISPYKDPQYILLAEATHKNEAYIIHIPIRNIIELDSKSVEDIQLIRPLSNRTAVGEYIMNIFLDSQENVMGMEISTQS